MINTLRDEDVVITSVECPVLGYATLALCLTGQCRGLRLLENLHTRKDERKTRNKGKVYLTNIMEINEEKQVKARRTMGSRKTRNKRRRMKEVEEEEKEKVEEEEKEEVVEEEKEEVVEEEEKE
ncbi:hypothetical protein M8J76_016230 [Diaphorina citri]|nr:hypothetical protein M8J76_016230 [Diaphorina citri]